MLPSLLLSLTLSAPLVDAGPPPGNQGFTSLALIVASNRGAQGGRPPLLYADDDGAKYQRVFATLAGAENTVLLSDLDRDTARLFPDLVPTVRSPTRVQLESAVDRLAARADELRRGGAAVRFYFVFAGHGDVDDGRGFLELADGPFTSEDLQVLLRTVRASEAHVILDSCNSFFVVNPRKPGGQRFVTPIEATEGLARRLPNVGVFLSTAAQAEVFEWSELQSGVFSHAVRSGLMGAADVDADGQVSYQELAAFVETAAAEIKNPLFRPKVFARGPNGEGGRAILDIPRTGRTALSVDEPAAVRLAVRDANGLRWLDAYKEPATGLRLWLPLALGPRPELERLAPAAEGTPQVEASFALPPSGDETLSYSALEPVRPTLANRGAGEVFQGLFRRPFGPVALASYLSRGPDLSQLDTQAVQATPAPGSTGSSILRALLDPGPGRRLSATFRGGALLPDARTSGLTVQSSAEFRTGAGGSVSIGYRVVSYLAAELEGGHLRFQSDPTSFLVPDRHYPWNREAPDAVLTYRAFPVGVNLKLQLPFGRARPYLLGGAGVVFASVEADPTDFSPTLRANGVLTELYGGGGLTVAFGDFFAGAEARYRSIHDAKAFDLYFDVKGVAINALVGFHFPASSR